MAPVIFPRIAHQYDALNRLISLGRDLRWRESAALALALPPDGRALDVGTGTGDMALTILRHWPGRSVIGLDVTFEMVRVGRAKPNAESIRWILGDGLRLPFPDACFDGVTSAFLLRNVPDVTAALAEQCRVVRPGGRVIALEMTWPRVPGFQTLFRLYFAGLMPLVAGALSGQPEAYRYLPRSVQRFMGPEELKAAMEHAGLQNVHYRLMALGSVALHVGERGR